MTSARVGILRLPHGEGLRLPHRKTADAAGLDLGAAVAADRPITIPPGGRALIPTGFALNLPSGFEAQVRPRSGLAAERGVTILNAPGTIDADYRGELKVLLVNLGDSPFEVVRGARIAQLVIAPVAAAELVEVRELGPTPRGAGGFGSTGVSE